MNNENEINWNESHDNQGRPYYTAQVQYRKIDIVQNAPFSEFKTYFTFDVLTHGGYYRQVGFQGTLAEVKNKVAEFFVEIGVDIN